MKRTEAAVDAANQKWLDREARIKMTDNSPPIDCTGWYGDALSAAALREITELLREDFSGERAPVASMPRSWDRDASPLDIFIELPLAETSDEPVRFTVSLVDIIEAHLLYLDYRDLDDFNSPPAVAAREALRDGLRALADKVDAAAQRARR